MKYKMAANQALKRFSRQIIKEDASSKTETTDQKQEQSSDMKGMTGMNRGQMMSNWKDQDAELDKLVAEMNSTSADKKTRRCRGRFKQTSRTAQGDA